MINRSLRYLVCSILLLDISILGLSAILNPVLAAERALSKPTDSNTGITRREHAFKIPDVRLIREDGLSLSARDVLAAKDNPVIVSFLFTSCRSTCPLSVGIYRDLQQRALEKGKDINLVSISIDPEGDTLDVLKAFRKEKGAGDAWHFYSGRSEDLVQLEKVMNVYRGDKMNHLNAFVIKLDAQSPWIWMTGGFIPANALAKELGL